MLPRTNPVQRPQDPVFLTILGLAVFCLIFSVLAQNWAGFEPCRLCLVQRHIYVGLGCLAFLGWVTPGKKPIRACLLGLLVVGIMVALYHSLIYLGVIGETKCMALTEAVQTLSDFKKTIDLSGVCSKSRPVLFGIPLPILNGIIYAVCFRFLKKTKC